MSSTAKEIGHLRAVEQGQQPLEFAAIVGGGVELEGKSASIKSSSECIHLSNASSLSSCFVLCSERSICISTTGSRRQLSIRKNERKGDNDEPDTPLLLERVRLPRFRGHVDRSHAMTLRLSINEQPDHDQAPVHTSAEAGGH